MDTAYAKSFTLKHRLCVCMGVSVAGEEQAEEDRWHVLQKASVRGVSGNSVYISGWYKILELGGIYNLIVG